MKLHCPIDYKQEKKAPQKIKYSTFSPKLDHFSVAYLTCCAHSYILLLSTYPNQLVYAHAQLLAEDTRTRSIGITPSLGAWMSEHCPSLYFAGHKLYAMLWRFAWHRQRKGRWKGNWADCDYTVSRRTYEILLMRTYFVGLGCL